MKTMLCAAVTLSLLSTPLLAQSTAPTPVAPLAIATLDAPQTLLAARGTAEILVADIDAFMEHVPARDRAAVVSSDERVATLLQGMLLNRQLAKSAEEQKLHEAPNVQREIQLAREQVLARHALRHFVESKPAGDLEQLALEAYKSEKSKYLLPEVRLVQHILINNQDRTDEEAKALISKVEAEARATGADFTELVQKYSDDSGKIDNKGFYRIDAESEPKMDPAFVGGARSVNQAGAISKPFVGMYGYHLIRLESLQEARQLSFEESKAKIIDGLRASYNKRVEDEYVSDLRTQNPEIVTEVAQRLKSRYLPSTIKNSQ